MPRPRRGPAWSWPARCPPPWGGQNVMIARILAQFAASPDFECAHLAFFFTNDFKTVRRGSASKAIELLKVLARLAALRFRGPIDVMIYPAGGPQTVPMLRDLLLLPWVLISAHRVVLQFHAAGIADRCARGGLLCRVLRAVYTRCAAAIVMTKFNRRDPAALGIEQVAVLPHRMPDEYDLARVERRAGETRLLYVGHLCADKGTPDLLRAFATLAAGDAAVTLELVGETLPPFSDRALRELIEELRLGQRVTVSGVLTGRAKQEAFGRAQLFVFPSVAPYESFGLVMVEAFMWGLPVIATDWRGNRDVLGADFEGICHPVGELTAALESALSQLHAGQWTGRNRALFLGAFASRRWRMITRAGWQNGCGKAIAFRPERGAESRVYDRCFRAIFTARRMISWFLRDRPGRT